MKVNVAVLKSVSFVVSESVFFALFLLLLVMTPDVWLIELMLFIIMSLMLYVIADQYHQITELQAELRDYSKREDDSMIRTEQLRRALHDLRSPLSALNLRIQLMQKSGHDNVDLHLQRMDDSLDAAIHQIETISEIQKGKLAPTDTLMARVRDLRANSS